MRDGEAVAFAEYGLPGALAHGRPVQRARVHRAGAPAREAERLGAARRPSLWAASRLVPAMRRRDQGRRGRAGGPAVAGRRRALVHARSERRGWPPTWRCRPRTPTAWTDAALVDHLRRVRAHAATGYERHFSLHGPDMVPAGMLLARCDDWGIPPDLALAALTGASPASTGRGPRLQALQAAVAASGADPQSIDEVRAVAGAELDAFLAEHGWHLVDRLRPRLARAHRAAVARHAAWRGPRPEPVVDDGAVGSEARSTCCSASSATPTEPSCRSCWPTPGPPSGCGTTTVR